MYLKFSMKSLLGKLVFALIIKTLICKISGPTGNAPVKFLAGTCNPVVFEPRLMASMS